MGMSTRVTAFRDMNGEFKKMLEAKKFCDERELSYPAEVRTYFGNCADQSEESIAQELLTIVTKDWVKEWSGDYGQGFEVDVASIPKEVKTIRFYNSW